MSSPEIAKKPNLRSVDEDMNYSETDGQDDKVRMGRETDGLEERIETMRTTDRHEEKTRRRSDAGSNEATQAEHKRRRHRRHRYRDDDQTFEDQRDEDRQRHHRRRKSHDPSSSRPSAPRKDSPDSVNSSETVELPPRFDHEGKKVPERGEDPLADKIEDLLSGKGLAGGIFKRLTGDLLGGGDGSAKRRR
jgi:hypothetical protein